MSEDLAGTWAFSAPHSHLVHLLGRIVSREGSGSRFVCSTQPPIPEPSHVWRSPVTAMWALSPGEPGGPAGLEGGGGCDWACLWPAFSVHVCHLGSVVTPWHWFVVQAWWVGVASTRRAAVLRSA